jgi:hypothetical protein
MSQVIIPHDSLQIARDRTQLEENKIFRAELPIQWIKSDVTHTLLIEKLIGMACLPICGIWALLLTCASISLSLCLGLFQIGSQLIRIFRIR